MSVNIFNKSDESLTKCASNLFGDDDYKDTKSQVAINKENISSLETNKVDKATTLSGYGITNAYTKTEIDTKESSLKSDITTLGVNISDAYDSTKTYAVGDYCIYDNQLWKCIASCTGITPTEGTNWTQVSVGDELTQLFTVKECTTYVSKFTDMNVSNFKIEKVGRIAMFLFSTYGHVSASDQEIVVDGIPSEFCPIIQVTLSNNSTSNIDNKTFGLSSDGQITIRYSGMSLQGNFWATYITKE